MEEVTEQNIMATLADTSTTPAQMLDVVGLQATKNLWSRWKEYTDRSLIELADTCQHVVPSWKDKHTSYSKYMQSNVGCVAGSLTMVQACCKPVRAGDSRTGMIDQGLAGIRPCSSMA